MKEPALVEENGAGLHGRFEPRVIALPFVLVREISIFHECLFPYGESRKLTGDNLKVVWAKFSTDRLLL